MFILSLTYVAPLQRIDELMGPHVAWLKTQHKAGHFLAWGRKVPRKGGIILARGDRAEIEALARTDPFVEGDAATVDVIEWTPSFVAPGLEGFEA